MMCGFCYHACRGIGDGRLTALRTSVRCRWAWRAHNRATKNGSEGATLPPP
jgi:hypothetical protein